MIFGFSEPAEKKGLPKKKRHGNFRREFVFFPLRDGNRDNGIRTGQ